MQQKEFNEIVEKYVDKKITIIKPGLQKNIDHWLFRKKLQKVWKYPQNYQAHHILPKSLFPHLIRDIDNGIPLSPVIHERLHEEFTNCELAIDPIGCLIEVIRWQ